MANLVRLTNLEASQLRKVYAWVDKVPLSREPRNISRDFSDGVLCAEVVSYYKPNIVDLHNYPKAHSQTQKISNWETLNQKVFRRMGLILSRKDLIEVAQGEENRIEQILHVLMTKIDKQQKPKKALNTSIFDSPTRVQRKKQFSSPKSPNTLNPVLRDRDSKRNTEVENLKTLHSTIKTLELKIKSVQKRIEDKNTKIFVMEETLISAGVDIEKKEFEKLIAAQEAERRRQISQMSPLPTIKEVVSPPSELISPKAVPNYSNKVKQLQAHLHELLQDIAEIQLQYENKKIQYKQTNFRREQSYQVLNQTQKDSVALYNTLAVHIDKLAGGDGTVPDMPPEGDIMEPIKEQLQKLSQPEALETLDSLEMLEALKQMQDELQASIQVLAEKEQVRLSTKQEILKVQYQIKESKIEIENLEKEIINLQDKFEQAGENEDQEQIDTLKIKLSSARESNFQIQKQKQDTELELQSKGSLWNELQETNNFLLKEGSGNHEKYTSRLNTLREEVQSTQEDLQSCTDNPSSQDGTIKELKEEINMMSAQIFASTQISGELDSFREQVNDKDQQLELVIAQRDELSTETYELQEQLLIQQDLASVEHIEAENSKKLVTKSADLEMRIYQIEEEKLGHQNEIIKLKKKLEKAMKNKESAEMDESANDQRKAKQQFLQTEIIEAGLSPDDFTIYCREEKSSDIEEWEFDELVECVKVFKSFVSSSNQEKPGKTGSEGDKSDNDGEQTQSEDKNEDTAVKIEDSPEAIAEARQQAKQQFLKEEIIDAGFSPDDFTIYCREEKSSDIEEWEFDELVEWVKGFKFFVGSPNRENRKNNESEESSSSSDSEQMQNEEKNEETDLQIDDNPDKIAEAQENAGSDDSVSKTEDMKEGIENEDTDVKIDDEPEDIEDPQRQKKQQFLMEEIIEAGYSPDDFTLYCREEKSSDIEEWDFDELVECVKGFKSMVDNPDREKSSKSGSESSRSKSDSD